MLKDHMHVKGPVLHEWKHPKTGAVWSPNLFFYYAVIQHTAYHNIQNTNLTPAGKSSDNTLSEGSGINAQSI